MATISIIKERHNNAKKGVAVATATLRPAEFGIRDGLEADGTLAVGDKVTLFNLPADCVVTHAFVVTKKVPTETTTQFKLLLGSGELMTSTQVAGNAGGIAGSATADLYTGATGMPVTLEIGTAAVKSGEFCIVVEFLELNKSNGEYLNA